MQVKDMQMTLAAASLSPSGTLLVDAAPIKARPRAMSFRVVPQVLARVRPRSFIYGGKLGVLYRGPQNDHCYAPGSISGSPYIGEATMCYMFYM